MARGELFEKPGRVNIEERRRQRAAQRNPAYGIGEGLAGAHADSAANSALQAPACTNRTSIAGVPAGACSPRKQRGLC